MPIQRRVSSVAIALALLSIDSASAQSASADVTFAVPLNLTNLAGDITKVRVTCSMPYGNLSMGSTTPAMRRGEVELPVTGGQVVTTALVLVALPATAMRPDIVGTTQSYSCVLHGYSPSLGWNEWNDLDMTGSFRSAQFVGPPRNSTFQW
jgi:hypothetical protein